MLQIFMQILLLVVHYMNSFCFEVVGEALAHSFPFPHVLFSFVCVCVCVCLVAVHEDAFFFNSYIYFFNCANK